MKALLIFPILKDLNKADGILVKNEGIRKGFLANNIEADVLEFTSEGIFCGDKKIVGFSPNRLRRIWQYNTAAWKAIGDYVSEKSYDLIWFRLPMVQPFIASFLEQVKKKQPGCRIILEYGAYPYENELDGLKKWLYRMNKRSEKKAHRYADRVITYCGQREVDGIPNIPINNGIDLENIPVLNTALKEDEAIHFISVSSIKKWHAYERFILGMAGWDGSTPIHFHVVGDGPELQKLKDIAKQNGLDDQVSFHGFQSGAALDEVYQRAHVAIGTLGFHRIGLTHSSSLKNREYFARGLPVVLSTPDQDMPPELPFVSYVAGDESAVNLSEVVRFAKWVYQSQNVNSDIRQYAEDHLSWKSKIAEVLAHAEVSRESRPPALQST